MLGVPGSGKGTQAKMLSEKLKLSYVSSGDLFRNMDQSSEIGKKARPYMDAGELVPDDIVMELMKEYLLKNRIEGNIILDGFPRTVNQAEQLESLLTIDHVIYIDISEEEFYKRLGGRRTCPKCEKNYNIFTEPKPKTDGICDDCGEQLFQRKDQTTEALKTRLEVYHDETEPLVEFYDKLGIVLKIDGMGTVDEVENRIEIALDNAKKSNIDPE